MKQEIAWPGEVRTRLDRVKAKLSPHSDTPFFAVNRHVAFGKCDHAVGVVLDVPTRTVTCKCGQTLDPFDALMVYANAEQRLVNLAALVNEHRRRQRLKQIKKDSRRTVERSRVYRGLNKASAAKSRARKRVILTMECGHEVIRDARLGTPKALVCWQCYSEKSLQEQ